MNLLVVFLCLALQSATTKQEPVTLAGLNEKQAADAQKAIAALSGLGNRILVGITLQDYKRRVVEAKNTIDPVITSLPDTELRKRITKAIDFHLQALNVWKNFQTMNAQPITEAELQKLKEEWPGFTPTDPHYLSKDDAVKYLWGKAAEITKELNRLMTDK